MFAPSLAERSIRLLLETLDEIDRMLIDLDLLSVPAGRDDLVYARSLVERAIADVSRRQN